MPLNICGEEAIFMPELDECDECEAFAERLDQLEQTVDDLPDYEPGDNISFDVQPDGTTKISAAGGTGGDYTPGDGIQISPANVISADVRRPMISDAEESPALAPHAVGEYLIYDNTLYRVKAAIAVDDPLVVDTNIAATSVGEELYTPWEEVPYTFNTTDFNPPTSFFFIKRKGVFSFALVNMSPKHVISAETVLVTLTDVNFGSTPIVIVGIQQNGTPVAVSCIGNVIRIGVINSPQISYIYCSGCVRIP